MDIMDLSDPSRNVRIEFCDCGCYNKDYPCTYHMGHCHPWKSIKKLTYFCRYAKLQRILYGVDVSLFNLNLSGLRFLMWSALFQPVFMRNVRKFSFKSDHGHSSKSLPLDVFVETFTASFNGKFYFIILFKNI